MITNQLNSIEILKIGATPFSDKLSHQSLLFPATDGAAHTLGPVLKTMFQAMCFLKSHLRGLQSCQLQH